VWMNIIVLIGVIGLQFPRLMAGKDFNSHPNPKNEPEPVCIDWHNIVAFAMADCWIGLRSPPA
jgi:hypothetical protein